MRTIFATGTAVTVTSIGSAVFTLAIVSILTFHATNLTTNLSTCSTITPIPAINTPTSAVATLGNLATAVTITAVVSLTAFAARLTVAFAIYFILATPIVDTATPIAAT